jgi:hypothetical protein
MTADTNYGNMSCEINERIVFKVLWMFWKQKHVNYDLMPIAYLVIQFIREAWQSSQISSYMTPRLIGLINTPPPPHPSLLNLSVTCVCQEVLECNSNLKTARVSRMKLGRNTSNGNLHESKVPRLTWTIRKCFLKPPHFNVSAKVSLWTLLI